MQKICNKEQFRQYILWLTLIIILLFSINMFVIACNVLYFFVCPLTPVLRSVPVPVDYELHGRFLNFISQFNINTTYTNINNEFKINYLYNEKSI